MAIVCHINLSYGAHEPDAGSPAFVRSAVEGRPENTDQFERLGVEESFGEKFLPLRSAVESAPKTMFVYPLFKV